MAYTIQQSTARDAGKCRAVTCCGLDDPLANYTADHEELDSYVSVAFSDYYQALGVDCEGQPCTVVYESSISQADADAQAALAALQCSIATCEDQDGNEIAIYYNQEVSCSTPCSSGGSLTTVVPAGLYFGTSQEEADGIALAQCSVAATNLSLCIVGEFGGGCVDEAYTDTLAITSASSVVDASVVSGALPAGLSLDFTGSSVTVSGTPTICGTSEFTIQIVDDQGNVGSRSFSIVVLQITTATPLPDFELGVPYNVQFTACGGSGEYKWELDSGTLPTGMTLTETGLLSGAPTEATNFSFTIKVTDGEAADLPPIEPPDEPQPVTLYAYFAFVPQYGSRPATVDFQDQSISAGPSITSWLWDFGDGTTSTLRNPSHEYNDDGTTAYIVTLTVFNGSISDSVGRHLPFNQRTIQLTGFNFAEWTGCASCLAVDGDDWDGQFIGRGTVISDVFGPLPSWIKSGLTSDGKMMTARVLKDNANSKYIMFVTCSLDGYANVGGDLIDNVIMWYGEKAFATEDPLLEFPTGTYTRIGGITGGCLAMPTLDIEYIS